MEPFVLSGYGEVYSFSLIHSASNLFSHEVPYIIALIRMDDGPLVTGQIVDWNDGDVEIGTRVEAVFRKISEQGKQGIIQYGYKFKPILSVE